MLSPFSLYTIIALGIALIGVGTFAGCEHRAAKQLRIELSTAKEVNASNKVTIGTQAKALEQWKALHSTPEEVASILSNAKAYVDEIDRLSKQVRFYRDKDKSLPECVRLMQASLSACPGRTAILHNFAGGNTNR